MLRYRVDISALNPDKKEEVYKLLDTYSHFAECVIGKNGMEAVVVNWDSSEDFVSSPIFPKGCPCTLIPY